MNENGTNGLEIKNKIDANNKMIEDMMTPNIFTLNNIVNDLLRENDELSKRCPHEYESGYCIYCYKKEENK